MNSQAEIVAYCPHCGNVAPQHYNGHTIGSGLWIFFLFECGTCQKALMYRSSDNPTIERWTQCNAPFLEWEVCELVWPSPGDLHSAVPERVRRIYAEAARIKACAPNAFANQIRRSLEAVCKDRGATNNSLAQNLRELATRREIPQTLAEMTEVLRQLGNVGSHDDDKEIAPE